MVPTRALTWAPLMVSLLGGCTNLIDVEGYVYVPPTGGGGAGGGTTSAGGQGGASSPVCNDGKLDPGEACDGTNYGGVSCVDVSGFVGGTIGCSDSCEIIGCQTSWSEDFESGDFGSEWVMGGDAPWVIDPDNVHGGSYAARSGAIGDNSSTTMEVTLVFDQPGSFSFWWNVGSEQDYDYLELQVNGDHVIEWSGFPSWEQYVYDVTAPGTYTFRFNYYKDDGYAELPDSGWIDDIVADNGYLAP